MPKNWVGRTTLNEKKWGMPFKYSYLAPSEYKRISLQSQDRAYTEYLNDIDKKSTKGWLYKTLPDNEMVNKKEGLNGVVAFTVIG